MYISNNKKALVKNSSLEWGQGLFKFDCIGGVIQMLNIRWGMQMIFGYTFYFVVWSAQASSSTLRANRPDKDAMLAFTQEEILLVCGPLAPRRAERLLGSLPVLPPLAF